MKLNFLILLIANLLIINHLTLAQSAQYQQKKAEALKNRSPFEDIVEHKTNREIIYEDKMVIVFEPLSRQAPIHLLIVPKKRIPTINDLTEKDSKIIAQMYKVAQKMAKMKGISESGYRLSINTNEDAGQSVFHIHLHLLGGIKLGPMVDQSYRNNQQINKTKE
jgi:histidine triad (HIT) family protein